MIPVSLDIHSIKGSLHIEKQRFVPEECHVLIRNNSRNRGEEAEGDALNVVIVTTPLCKTPRRHRQ